VAAAPTATARRRVTPLRARRRRVLVAQLLLVGASALLVGLDADVPVLRAAAGLLLLVGLPWLVLVRRADLPGDTPTARAAYALGVVVLGLTVIGLLLNTLLPPVGEDRPLQPAVLAITAGVADAVLLRWRWHQHLLADADGAPWTPYPGWWKGPVVQRLPMLASLSLFLCVVGAIRLNNGAPGTVAVIGHLLVALVLVMLVAGEDRGLRSEARIVWMLSAALLLGTSLRGWTITGHDIQTEHLVFLLTDQAQHWSMAAYQNAYNACLSITVLPTVVSQVTGLSGTIVFKVLAQLLFAVVPVVVLLVARRFVDRRLALVGVGVAIAFSTFHQDMPYLVRQEVAYLFVALSLLAGTEPHARARRWVLGMGLGIVLSHYSTTYVWLIALVGGLVLLGILRLWERRRGTGVAHPRLLLLSPLVVVSLALGSVAWTGPATHTGGHASEVFSSAVDALLGKGGGGPGASVLSYALLGGSSASPRERLDLYVEETLKTRDRFPADNFVVQDVTTQETRPEMLGGATVPSTGLGERLASAGLDPGTVTGLVKLAAAGVVQLALLVGALWLVWRRRSRSRIPDEYAAVCLGSLGSLVAIVLVPQLSVEYGVLRALEQALLVLAPVVGMGAALVLRAIRLPQPRVLALVPAGLVLVFVGVLQAAIGSYNGSLALGNDGTYYARYYASDAEVAALRRLARVSETAQDPPLIVPATSNIGLRLAGYTGDRARIVDAIYPTVLPRDAYVLADPLLAQDGTSTVFYSGDLLTYRYPMTVLDDQLDLVYSSGGSRVYR
jgi:uncharacterized membrane protein